MFTGIVEAIGTVETLERSGDTARIRVRVPDSMGDLAVSASIAVNGCCLTVVEFAAGIFSADLSGETQQRTAFGEVSKGARVNLERPLRAGAELGGHFVQGHVDGVGRVARLAREGDNWWLGVRVPPELARYVAMKGSIAIDGVSLTVAAMPASDVAEVAVIPFTYAHTNMSDLRLGDAVNIECDVLAKYLERLLDARGALTPSRLTVEKLIEQGF